VHQQRFQRVAGTGPRHLAIDQQAQGQARIGAGVHEQVAHALVVLDHRHARVFGHEADQALATARDGQVDDVGELQQFQHGLAREVFDHGQHRRIQAGFGDGAAQ